jgi:hypothetical protein
VVCRECWSQLEPHQRIPPRRQTPAPAGHRAAAARAGCGGAPLGSSRAHGASTQHPRPPPLPPVPPPRRRFVAPDEDSEVVLTRGCRWSRPRPTLGAPRRGSRCGGRGARRARRAPWPRGAYERLACSAFGERRRLLRAPREFVRRGNAWNMKHADDMPPRIKAPRNKFPESMTWQARRPLRRPGRLFQIPDRIRFAPPTRHARPALVTSTTDVFLDGDTPDMRVVICLSAAKGGWVKQ